MNDTITRANAAAPATPRVRRLANCSGVALAGIQGTGAGGRVTVNDVQRAAAVTPARQPAVPTPAVAAQAVTRTAEREREDLYAAVWGPAPEPALTQAQAQLYATVYGRDRGRDRTDLVARGRDRYAARRAAPLDERRTLQPTIPGSSSLDIREAG